MDAGASNGHAMRGNLISDAEAARAYDAFDSATGAERDAFAKTLTAYRTQREQQEELENASRVEGYYRDFETLGGAWDAKRMQPIMDRSMEPDNDKAAIANLAYLSQQFGQSPDALLPKYEIYRDQIASQKFGVPNGVTDKGFYDLVQQDYQTAEKREAALQEIPIDLASDRANGGATSTAAIVQRWKERYPDLIPPQQEVEILRQANQFAAAADGWISRNAEAAKSVHDVLRAWTDGKTDEGAVKQLSRSLIGLDPDKRQEVYGVAALLAKRSGDPKGFFEQLGESVLRGATDINAAFGRMEDEGMLTERLRELDSGMASRSGSFAAQISGDVSPKKLDMTVEERESEAEDVRNRLAAMQVGRELAAIAKGEIDPIQALSKGWLTSHIEQGMYGAAGSLPYLGLAAVPYAGLPIAASAYTATEYDRIRLAYPDVPVGQALAMSTVSGAVQGALDRLQVDLIAGALPMTSQLFRGLAKPTPQFWGPYIGKMGINLAEQNAQEALQDLTPIAVDAVAQALGADMPDVDWGKRFEDFAGSRVDTFFALLPLWIAGAGVGTAVQQRGLNLAFAQDADAMTSAGIPKDKAEEIANAQTAQKMNAMLRQAWDEVPQQSKQELIAKQDAAHAEMQATQKDPAMPSIEQGAEGYIVRDQQGKTIYQSQDAEAAQAAYQDSVERAAFDALLNQTPEQDPEGDALNSLLSGKDSSQLLALKEPPDAGGAYGDVDTAIGTEYQRVAKGFQQLGVRVVPKAGTRSVGVRSLADGSIALEVDPGYFREAEGRIAETGGRAGRFSELTFAEELIHAADLAALKNEWQARGDEGSFDDFVTSKNQALFGDIREVVDGAKTKDRNAMLAALRDSWRLYYDSYGTDSSTLPETDALLDHFESLPAKDLSNFASEFLRQAVQLKRHGELSEDTRTSLWRVLADWVRGAIDRIKAMLPGVRDGKFGKLAKDRIARMEELLDQVDAGILNPDAQISATRPSDEGSFFGAAPLPVDLDSRLQQLETNPEKRVDAVRRARKMLESMRDNRVVQPRPLDARPAIEDVEHQAAAERADLYAERDAEKENAGLLITEQFAERIDNAKTDYIRRSLNREANARLAERRKAIDQKYAERNKALNQRVRNKIERIKREAELADREAKAKTDAANQQVATVQAIAQLNAITRILPTEARGRIGGALRLAQIKTDAARDKYLATRVDKVGRELESYLRKQYAGKIKKLLKKSAPQKTDSGVSKSRLGPDAQRVADTARRAIDLDADATAARMSAIEAALEAGSQDPGLIEEWGILNMFGDLKNRNAETLAEAAKWLRDQLKEGAARRKVEVEARMDRIHNMQSAITTSFGKPTTSASFREASKTQLQRLRELGGSMLNSHLSFEQFLRTALPELDGIVEDFATRMRKADNGSTDAELAAREAMLNVVRDAARSHGMSAGAALVDLKKERKNVTQIREGRVVKQQKIDVDLAEKIVRGEASGHGLSKADVDRLSDALSERREALASQDLDAAMAGNDNAKLRTGSKSVTIERVLDEGYMDSVSMTPGQAMQLVLSWDQPDVRGKMEATGWSAESMQAVQDLVSDHPIAPAVLAHLRSYYAEGATKINPVYARIFGMHIPQTQKYAPTRFKHSGDLQEIGPDGMPMTLGSTPGFLKSRVSHKAKVDPKDALEVFSEHVLQQSHWTNFAELARDFRAVFSNTDVRGALEQAYGRDVLTQLDAWTNLMDKRGGDRAREASWISSFIGPLISGKAISSLGFNLRTIAMQVDSAMRFAFAMQPKDIVRALSHPGRLVDAASRVWQSPSIRRRVLGGMNPVVQFAFRRAAAKPGFGADLSHASMQPINYMDAVFTTLGSTAIYVDAHERAIANGATEAAAETVALDAVDAAVYRYSQPTGMGSKSLLENQGHPIIKIFMMFLSDARLKSGIMIDAAKGIASGKDVGKHAKNIMLIEAMALVSQLIANMYRDALSDDNDEEIWTASGFAKAAALAPFQGLLFLGSIADTTLSRLLSDRWFAPSRDPLLDQINRATQASQHWDDTLNISDPEAMLRQWDNIARAGAVSTGTAAPAAALNIAKPFLGLVDNLTTEESNEE